jgi:hypothetical protein
MQKTLVIQTAIAAKTFHGGLFGVGKSSISAFCLSNSEVDVTL